MTENEAVKEFNKMIGRKMMTKNGISEKDHELLQIAMDCLEEIQEYRAIGTVEQFREAMEKQKAKNPVKHDNCGNRCASYRCPDCFEIVSGKYCENCGQALDWGIKK